MTTERREDSPFGGEGSVGRRRLRLTLLAAVPVLAVIGVWLFTRNTATAPAPGAHNHAAGAPTSDSSNRLVMLSADEAQRIGVTYTEATMGALGKEVRTVGQVTFDETALSTISPRVDGWVEELYVNFTGQPIRAGQALLRVYSPMLVTVQEELLLAKRLEGEMLAAGSEEKANASELVSSARRRLAYWDIPQSEIDRIERTGQVQRTLTLRAPAHGVVVEKNVVQGQRIMAGEAIYRVADLRQVWVEGDVFEQDLPVVRLGLPVTTTFEALPGEEHRGRITYVYPTLNPSTRTARVRVELPNPGLRLKPGMYATLRLTGAPRPDVLSVPRSAVLSTGERNLVFVRRDDGMLEPREVTVGLANDERIEILRGLRMGETVVASATFLVDAESNLGTLMGGMGDMPGMDMTAPAAPGVPPAPPARKE